jgi:hypothetical protein
MNCPPTPESRETGGYEGDSRIYHTKALSSQSSLREGRQTLLPTDHADHTEEHSVQTEKRTVFAFSTLAVRDLGELRAFVRDHRVPLRSGLGKTSGDGRRYNVVWASQPCTLVGVSVHHRDFFFAFP